MPLTSPHLLPADDGPSQQPPAPRPFRRLLRYARPYLGILVLAILFSGLYAGARTARAYLLKPLLDDIFIPQAQMKAPASFGDWIGELGILAKGEAKDGAAAGPEEAAGEAPQAAPAAAEVSHEALAAQVRDVLPSLLLAVVVILFLLPVAHLGQQYLSEWVLGHVLVDIQQDLCRTLLKLPLDFHHRQSRGETLSRVVNDAQRAHTSLDLVFSSITQAVLTLIVGVATLFFISWQLTLTLAIAAPLVAGVIAVFGRRIRKSSKRRQESQGDVTRRLVQILEGIKVIKAFGAQEGEAAAFHHENQRWLARNLKVVKYRALSRSVVEGLTNTIGIAVLLGGIVVVLGGIWGLSMGSLTAFFVVMQSSTYRPIREMTKGWTRFQEAMPSADRFFELLDTPPERPDEADAITISGVSDSIRFDDVSFSYGREPVLHDVSLDVAAGEVIAIVGRTGSGKTTLADLLLGFYDPDGGAIEVDGVDLRRVARESWLAHVAVVTQDPFLFSGTIRDNIRYGRPDASDEEILAAACAAHVEEFASRLERGMETDVGEAGNLVSGGQRQRITIARAILRNPSVLIFDEATSSLDAESERYVQEAIESLLGGRTVFIIAHRLSTVRHADRILVLDGGTVAELGTHDELMERDGSYRKMMSLQGGIGPT
jgi:ABC-type multidrug transport system fused ATPase/permease subunit